MNLSPTRYVIELSSDHIVKWRKIQVNLSLLKCCEELVRSLLLVVLISSFTCWGTYLFMFGFLFLFL